VFFPRAGAGFDVMPVNAVNRRNVLGQGGSDKGGHEDRDRLWGRGREGEYEFLLDCPLTLS
jgi:hypothetical protein